MVGKKEKGLGGGGGGGGVDAWNCKIALRMSGEEMKAF